MTPKELIRELLLSRGMSQEELAKKAGYAHQSGIGNILNRNKTMRIDHLIKLCSAMGYDIAVIDRDTGEIQCRLDETTDGYKYSSRIDTDETKNINEMINRALMGK